MFIYSTSDLPGPPTICFSLTSIANVTPQVTALRRYPPSSTRPSVDTTWAIRFVVDVMISERHIHSVLAARRATMLMKKGMSCSIHMYQ